MRSTPERLKARMEQLRRDGVKIRDNSGQVDHAISVVRRAAGGEELVSADKVNSWDMASSTKKSA
jgi:hypothetical protein